MTRLARAAGRFAWDFLVGDTPGLTVATLVLLVAAFLLRDYRWVAAVTLPLLAAAALTLSLRRARRNAGPGRTPDEPASTGG